MNLPLVIIIIALIALLVGACVSYCVFYLQYAKKIEEITNKSNQIINQYTNDQPTLEIDQRIKCTRELLNLIDDTVSLELINNKRYEIFLNNKGNNIDVDKDIEEIAKNVFESLKPNVISNKNLVMTDEYLMKYITKRTFVAVFTYIDQKVTNQVADNETT